MSCWCHRTSACESGQCLTFPSGQLEPVATFSATDIPSIKGTGAPSFSRLLSSLPKPQGTSHSTHPRESSDLAHSSRLASRSGGGHISDSSSAHPSPPAPPSRRHQTLSVPSARLESVTSASYARPVPTLPVQAFGFCLGDASTLLAGLPVSALCPLVLSPTLTLAATPQPPRSQHVFMSTVEPGLCAASSLKPRLSPECPVCSFHPRLPLPGCLPHGDVCVPILLAHPLLRHCVHMSVLCLSLRCCPAEGFILLFLKNSPRLTHTFLFSRHQFACFLVRSLVHILD